MKTEKRESQFALYFSMMLLVIAACTFCCVFCCKSAHALTATPSFTATQTKTNTPTATRTYTPTRTPTFTPVMTHTKRPTRTAKPTYTAGATRTSTPTGTATPVNTATLTPTATVTVRPNMAYSWYPNTPVCPTQTPSCNSNSYPADSRGTHKVVFDLTAGTGTFSVRCQVGSFPDKEVCSFTADGSCTFTEYCDSTWIKVTNCAGCAYNAQLIQ
jgi:cytoskeletal protein RodZ